MSLSGHPQIIIYPDPPYASTYCSRMVFPSCAILRAIPDKLMGVLAMGGAIISFAALPWLDRSYVRSCRYRPVWKWCVWIFVIDFFVLMYCGAMLAEEPYVTISSIGTAYWSSIPRPTRGTLVGLWEIPIAPEVYTSPWRNSK